MPTFWIALVALYVVFFQLGWFPGADRLDPGVTPPPHQDRALHGRRAARRCSGRLFVRGVAPPRPARARARRLQRQPAHALHALGRARGGRQRLRPRGAGEGPAGARSSSRATSCARRCRRSSPCIGLVFANVLTGAVLVEKIFSWPGHRPVRVPRRRQPRRAGDRGRQPVRRGRLHHGQLHRRRPLRRHRPEDPGHMSTRRASGCARGDAARLQPGVAAAARDRRRRDRRRVARWSRSSRRCSRRTTRSRRSSRRRSRRRARTCSAPTSSVATCSAASSTASRISMPLALLLVDARRRSSAALLGGDRRLLPRHRRTAWSMRIADLVFAFPAIILAMVVDGRARAAACATPCSRSSIVAWPAYARVVRGLVLSVGDSEYVAVGAPARRVGAPHARPRRAAERRRPGARARDARPRRRDPAALRPLVPRARRAAADRRVGRDGRRRARSTSSTGGSARSPASRSSPSCSPSTSSATACATSSTRRRRGGAATRE